MIEQKGVLEIDTWQSLKPLKSYFGYGTSKTEPMTITSSHTKKTREKNNNNKRKETLALLEEML